MELGRLTAGGLALAVGVSVMSGTAVVRGPAHAVLFPRELVLTGTFAAADAGWSVERDFDVVPGTSRLEIEVTGAGADAVPLDFGIRGPAGLRGWSIARDARVHIDAMSASTGYLPGALEPGRWQIMIGPPAPPAGQGLSYEITIRLSNQADAFRPIVRPSAGWFAGDLHVHSGHSDGYHADSRGRQRPVGVRDLAGGAEATRLDFLAVTDHNTASHWVDVDRTQSAFPDLLLLHGREITTARGHFNAIGERRFTDFRLGPLRGMPRLLADVARDGAFVSINHAWLVSDQWCAGCGWADRDADTMSHVAGIEIVNGSTPEGEAVSPGWRFWSDRLNRGDHLVAVGGSDVHDPIDGRAAIGRPSTVVWAAALSEEAIVAGLGSGRVFVRAEPAPDRFVDLRADADGTTTFMGRAMAAGPARVTARVSGAAGQDLTWIRRGAPVASVHLRHDDASVALPVDAVSGDWFSVIVSRNGQPTLFSNAVYVR